MSLTAPSSFKHDGDRGNSGHYSLSMVDLTPLRELVCRIARTFFSTNEIIVLDYMSSLATPILSDFDLGTALRVGSKEASKLCARLVESRLLRMESKNDSKRPEGKLFPRTFYVLDYKLFLDSTKWKMMRLERNIRSKVERDMDNRGYLCPQCDIHYSSLEAMANRESFKNNAGSLDFRFLCRIDKMVLEEDKSCDVVRLGNATLESLNLLTRPIMELIRRCDNVALPKYNVHVIRELLAKSAAEAKAAANASLSPNSFGSVHGGPASAFNSRLGRAAASAAAHTDIVVELPSDATEDDKKTADLQDNDIKNALPVWHQISTVTGLPHSLPDHLSNSSAKASAQLQKRSPVCPFDSKVSRKRPACDRNDTLPSAVCAERDDLDKYLEEYRRKSLRALESHQRCGTHLETNHSSPGEQDLETPVFSLSSCNGRSASSLALSNEDSQIICSSDSNSDIDDFEEVSPLSHIPAIVATAPTIPWSRASTQQAPSQVQTPPVVLQPRVAASIEKTQLSGVLQGISPGGCGTFSVLNGAGKQPKVALRFN